MDRRQVHLDAAKTHLIESAEIKRRVAEECLPDIWKAADLISNAFQSGNKMLLCGNGGSAADCQHLAAEFVSRLSKDFERRGLPAMALTTDTSFLTAFTNDCGFEGVFERQVLTFGKTGDVLLGISTSGNSTNVIKAVEVARNLEMISIVLVGNTGVLSTLADLVISVPSSKTQYIQESHITIGHIICDLVETIMFGKAKPRSRQTVESPLPGGLSMFSKNEPDALTQVKAGVGVIVVNDLKRVLLELRSDCGLWGLPGGRIEPGESVEQAVIREVKEETGLDVCISRMIGVYSKPSGRIVTYPDNGDVRHLIDIVVEAKVWSGELTRSNESLDLGFFDRDSLPAEIVPPAVQPLKDYFEGKAGVLA